MPRISTIMAVYNVAPYVADAVRSVQAQRVEDLEIVVVDDGSTDETPTILAALAREDPRICLIRQGNAGVSAARNAGLAASTGMLIAFLDGDDLYEPAKLERQLAVMMAHPDVGVCFHDLARFEGDPTAAAAQPHLRSVRFLPRAQEYFERVTGTLYVGAPDAFKILTVDYLGIWTGSIMFRRELLGSEEQPFQTELRVAEDVDLWLRLIRRTRVAYLDEVLSLYRQHATSAMASTPLQQFVRDDHRVRVHYLHQLRGELSRDEWLRFRNRIAQSWFELGYASFSTGSVDAARSDYLQAFRTRPHLRPLLAYLKTFAPEGVVRWRRAEPSHGSGASNASTQSAEAD